MLRRILQFIREAFTAFMADNGTLLAAAISYNFLFSLFPFILAVVSVAGFFLEPAELQREVIRGLSEMMPLAQGMITQAVRGIIDARGALSAFAMVLLLVSSASFFNAARNALNTAWGVKRYEPFLRGQLVNILMMMSAGLLLSCSLAAGYLPGLIDDYLARLVSVRLREANQYLRTGMQVFSVLLECGVFLLVYRWVPARRPPWRAVWWGALAMVAANEALKYVFLWYIRTFNPYHLVYGSIGALIAFLAWVYFSALLFLFIAKIMALALDHRRRSTPDRPLTNS